MPFFSANVKLLGGEGGVTFWTEWSSRRKDVPCTKLHHIADYALTVRTDALTIRTDSTAHSHRYVCVAPSDTATLNTAARWRPKPVPRPSCCF